MNGANGRQSRWPRWLCGIFLAACVSALSPAWGAAPQAVWELTPYRIRIVLGLERAAELTPGLEANLRTELGNQIERWIGAAWEASVTAPPPRLQEQMTADLASVSLETLPSEWLEDDKVALLTVSVDLDGYQVAGRELDVRTRQWSPVIRTTAYHPARLSDTLFWVLHRAFTPLAVIESVEKDTAVLRLRGAHLPPRDKAFLVTAPKDVFQPIVRYNDREGRPRRVTPIPWTYFVVREVEQAVLQCELHTGIRSPLSGRRRGRVEQLALAIRPAGGSTHVLLRSRTDEEKPLVGYEVYRHLGDSKTTEYLGRSDRQGSLLLESGGDESLRILVVKNGTEVLARLPLMIGQEAEMVVPVPDDDQRLEAEGFLSGFQEDLVDLVTRRQMVQTQVRARIQAKEFDEAQQLIAQLRQMRGRDECIAELNRQKQKIFSKDTSVQRKIDKLFADTRSLLQEFLNPNSIEQLARELREARQGKLSERSSAADANRSAGGVSGSTERSTTPASPAPQGSSAAGRG